jgi:tetratricopeptide (TPR) repeat protein
VSRRLGAILFLCAAIGISFAMSVRSLDARISARNLLREAARDRGPLDQIFAQQAGQGYYSDALVTARQFASGRPRSEDELSGLTEYLIEMRAENGDIQGAKGMIKQFSGALLGARGPQTTREIARIQVERGNLGGALETCATPEDADKVIEELGSREIASGDFDGALKTAEQISERSAYDLFYEVGEALRQRGEQQRLHELASRMTDRKRAAEFLDAARTTLWPWVEIRTLQPTPCDIAWMDGNAGKFAEAYVVADQNRCRYSDIASKQFATDTVEAERELRRSTDTADVSNGLAHMSEAAAKQADVANAIRLLDSARQVSGKQDFCLDCVREIAWAWTLKGQSRVVLRWARSMPIADPERGFALFGLAQALGHARPK